MYFFSRISRILPYVGVALAVLGFSMFIPMLMSLYLEELYTKRFGLLGIAGILTGLLLYKVFKRTKNDIMPRDAYLLVTSTWLVAGIYGAIPYLWHGVAPGFPQAFFEAVSCFTTTAPTVIAGPESLPRSLLLYRSLSFWMGGLGIVVLFVSMLSYLGAGGTMMWKAEATGPVKIKLAPRIRDTARFLCLTYLSLTSLMILVFYISGMTLYDAVCHAFSAISLGGFSTQDEGVIAYGNKIVLIYTVFCLISSLRIHLYYLSFKERSVKPFWRNEESRTFLIAFSVFVGITSISLWASGKTITSSMMDGFTFMTSIFTTVCFLAVDYKILPPIFLFLWKTLPYIGACSGSCSGGLKMERFIILVKEIRSAIIRVLHPRAVVSIRLHGKPVPVEIVGRTVVFFFIYILIIVLSTGLFCLLGYDLHESFSVVSACINNTGLAYNQAGPFMDYSHLPVWSMFFLPFLMIVGRLELYTVLVMFNKGFWKEG